MEGACVTFTLGLSLLTARHAGCNEAPKTYPSLACPIFTIEKPLLGLTTEQVTKLSHAVNGEAQKCRGSEMVFQVCFPGFVVLREARLT